MSEAIAAIATGAQVAAIGVVRLSGDGVLDIADALFRPASGGRMREQESRRLVYGSLYDAGGELLDRCLCTLSRAPHSYTGEDTAEFQCHGSPMLLRTLLDNLFKLGVTMARLNKKDEACIAFKNFAKEYPKVSDSMKKRLEKEVQKLSCP